MEGKDGRTEKPTAKKRKEARNKGQLAVSQEVNTVIVLVLGLFGIRWGVPIIGRYLKMLLTHAMQMDLTTRWSVDMLQHAFVQGCLLIALMITPILAPAVLAGVIANICQTKPYFSMGALRFNWKIIDPVKGFKELFSFQSIFRFFLSLLKVILVILALFLLLRHRVPELIALHKLELKDSVWWTFMLIMKIAWLVAFLLIVVAVLDAIYQYRKYEKNLMMTKQEVKEERKSQEPNPIVKKAQFRKMREMAMKRMMAAVPEATVVVTNPTHVAVALKYEPDTMEAPVVVAKGLRLVAQRIKRIAREHDIPIVERPSLARQLYKDVQVGSAIPASLFGAIAELLAYLYRLGNPLIREKLTAKAIS